jgi:hypothetical protein
MNKVFFIRGAGAAATQKSTVMFAWRPGRLRLWAQWLRGVARVVSGWWHEQVIQAVEIDRAQARERARQRESPPMARWYGHF